MGPLSGVITVVPVLEVRHIHTQLLIYMFDRILIGCSLVF
jgi:hypothetical protein